MELLEGQTLKHLIERGPIKLAQLLEIGIQIAEALEAAHARGVAETPKVKKRGCSGSVHLREALARRSIGEVRSFHCVNLLRLSNNDG
jgi:hypothetical protein